MPLNFLHLPLPFQLDELRFDMKSHEDRQKCPKSQFGRNREESNRMNDCSATKKEQASRSTETSWIRFNFSSHSLFSSSTLELLFKVILFVCCQCILPVLSFSLPPFYGFLSSRTGRERQGSDVNRKENETEVEFFLCV